jgi:hypothetical protein
VWFGFGWVVFVVFLFFFGVVGCVWGFVVLFFVVVIFWFMMGVINGWSW